MSTARVPGPVEGGNPTFSSALAHQPEISTSFGRFYATLWSDGQVDHLTKEIVRLRNARVTDCGY